ncbi:MAG: choice-of-anchor D domain-containing protein, partial [Thermoleophilia bacterium]|nr:choice-of-anchor D domain-containing protein [Thermoleophilia bacterium]
MAYDVTPAPAAVDFGTVAPGTTSAAQVVTFTNPFWPSVGWNLADPAATITGADAGDFAVASTTCATLLQATCTATVAFTPTGVGRRDGAVELIQSTGGVASAATLTGTAIASPSLITASQSGFANPTAGTATTGVVTFTNTSSVAIPLGAASIAGSSALTLPAGGVNTCSGATLPAGGQCGVQVSFLPTAAGTATATVSLASTGLSGPANGAVSVTAAAAVAALPFYSGNVPICHRTGNGGYVFNAPNYSSIVGGRGHGSHSGDIIPAFNYPGGSYPGKNWPPSGRAASSTCVRALIAGATPPANTQLRPPNPPVQQTVTLCHATGPGTWMTTRVPADQAYDIHGRHRQDIIPPFTLRTASGNVAFPGQNWDRDGRRIIQNDCRAPAMVSTLTPTDSVTLCSVPTDGRYARLSLSIPNALAYARTDPTAIIPPFSYRDGSSTRRFQGLNWSSRGKATFNNGCVDPDPPVQRITPSVQCVQVAADGTLTAYFDVSNPNGSTIPVAPGAGNQVTGSGFTAPTPPGAFAPGTAPRVLTVTGIPRSGSATWSITAGGITSTAVASGLSPACAVPPEPPKQIGVFVSCIRSEGGTYGVVFGYENGGTTPVTIPAGTANGVVLSSESTTDAPNRGQVTTFAPGRNPSAFEVKGVPRGTTISWIVAVAPIAPGTVLAQATRVAGATVPDGAPACATTPPTPTTVPPTTGPQPPDLTSLVPIGVQVTCVRSNGNGSFDAIFGYTNANPVAITAAAGPLNRVTPSLGGTGDDQGQVQEFLPGSLDN